MGGGSEVARLYASVGADIDDYTRNMGKVDRDIHSFAKTRAVAKADIDITAVDKKLAGLRSRLGSTSGLMQGLIGGIAGGATFAAFGTVTSAISGVFNSMVTGAAEMEKYRVQWEVLLGSLDKAKARMAELTEFAKVTPFELTEVVQASKTLQVFGGDVLATGKNLTLVGDIASGTGQGFSEIAMWIGRAYDAMKSGRPFGEAAMRLQEMGAMSGESRAKLEQLAEQVKTGGLTIEQAWASAGDEFGRFSGMMEKQSETLEGKWSNLSDAVHQAFANWGEKFLPNIKSFVDAAIAKVNELVATVDNMATAFRNLGTAMGMSQAQAENLLPDVIRLGTEMGVLLAVLSKFPTAAPLAAAPIVPDIWDLIPGAKEFRTQVNDLLNNYQSPFEQPARAGADVFGAGPQQADLYNKVMTTNMSAAWAEAKSKAEAGVRAVADAIGAGKGQVDIKATTMMSGVAIAVTQAKEAAALAASQTPGAIAEAIRNRRADWMGALDQLRDDMSHSMTKTAEIAALKAALVSSKLKEGLASGDPVVKEQAKATTQIIVDRLIELQGKTKTYGENLGNAYAQGIIDSKAEVEAASLVIAKAASRFVVASSPPKEGPLKDIYKWGRETALGWALGWTSGTGAVAGAVKDTMSKAADAIDDAIARLKDRFSDWQSWLAAFPPRTADAIAKAMRISTSQLASLWKDLSAGEQMQGVLGIGQALTAQGAASKESPEVQKYLAAVDVLQDYIAKLMRAATATSDLAKRQELLAKAGTYSARISQYQGIIDELKQSQAAADVAAQQAAQTAADVATYQTPEGGYMPDYTAYAPAVPPAAGTGTMNVNVTAYLEGPVLDPYSDYAQRIAAALIPGIIRELSRQGINIATATA